MRCRNCFNEISEEVEYCPSCDSATGFHPPAVSRSAAEVPETSCDSTESDQTAESGVKSTAAAAAGGTAAAAASGLERNLAQMTSQPNYRSPGKTGHGTSPKTSPKTSPRTAYKSPGKKNAFKGNVSTKATANEEEDRRKRIYRIIEIAAVVVILAGVAFYFAQSSGLLVRIVDPKDAVSAVERVRGLSSKQAGLTVDQAMTAKLEESRRAGRLASYQGWISRPVRGDTSKVMVIFSYLEQSNNPQNAEWLVDVSDNTVTPKNDVAASVYGN